MNLSVRVRNLIRESLREDIGREDVTTRLLVPDNLEGEAYIEAKEKGIFCGGHVAKEVFLQVDPHLKISQKVLDGYSLSQGRKVLILKGKIFSILKAERVALNFLGRLSGIATLTRAYVQSIRGTKAKIYDTRKTIPLWRELEKYAVKCGGGENHRFGLWDEILVKDNHWVSIRKMMEKNHRGYFAKRLSEAGHRMPIQIEVDDLKQVKDLLKDDVIPHRILLDNFSISNLKKAVSIVNKSHSHVLLEASGGITLKNVRKVAKTGVQRISIGALTHSASSIDFSLAVSKITP